MKKEIPEVENPDIYALASTETFPVDVRSCKPNQICVDGKPTGLWHFTEVSNDANTCRPIGFCAEGCPGHPCAEAARDHYREWLVTKSGYLKIVQDEPSERPCFICGTPTRGKAVIEIDWFQRNWTFRLCPQHQTAENVSKFLEIEDFSWPAWWPEFFG